MDREVMGFGTRFNSHVVDDGWNLPVEIVEAIDLRVQKAWQDAYKNVCREHSMHQGGWLTADVVRKFEAKSWIYRELYGHQYIAEIRKFAEELQNEYGVTELEAVNILYGCNVKDYLNKYYRIQHKIPLMVDVQAVRDEVIMEYMAM